MIISHKLNSVTSQLNVNCYAGSIKLTKKVKYLGVIIDNNLNFVEIKISTSICILDKLKNYLDLTSLLKLYYALIHSYINYGLIIWEEHLFVISDKIKNITK